MAINQGYLAQQLVRFGKWTFHLTFLPFCELTLILALRCLYNDNRFARGICSVLPPHITPLLKAVNPWLKNVTLTNDAA